MSWTNWICINYECNYSNTTNSVAYLTSTPRGISGSIVWNVGRNDSLHQTDAYSDYGGIRPVIGVDKTIFQ